MRDNRIIGLTKNEVEYRIKNGLVNKDETPKSKTIGQIFKDNIFNYFNFLNILLGGLIIFASIFSGNFPKGMRNCLFMGVVIVNTIISIVEEIISKKIIDKLSIVTEKKVHVIRDEKEKIINIEEIVKDDAIILSSGKQIACDSVILEGSIEVNESLITGEDNSIRKDIGDKLLSGSIVVSGNCIAKVENIGKNNYTSKITSEAKYKKEVNSIVKSSFVNVLKFLSILIIPIGILMLCKEYAVTGKLPDALFSTVASLIGMIPEGLILLSSSVMAVGIIKLYKVNVLVQELYSVETLARVDTICLDKTGTLTEGKMKYIDIIYLNRQKEEIIQELRKYVLASTDTNQTMNALKEKFKGESIKPEDFLEFSSSRKYSSITFGDTTYFLGGVDVLNIQVPEEYKQNIKGYRTLGFGKSKEKELSKAEIEPLGIILIEDVIRSSAKKTLDYFRDNGVDVKIISGDNVNTVLEIAKKVGLKNIKGANISDLNYEQIDKILDETQVFGRVLPEQKKTIIKLLKKRGRTVAMTGDGVNDCLALKESDCAISIKSGTEAARNVSQLILLNDDFNSLPKVVEEGRQIINNIKRSASLLLMKTMYTILLIVFSVLSFQRYFFIPIQLTFITAFTIGAPSFFLALAPNKRLVKGDFLKEIVSNSLPVALTVLINVILVTIISSKIGLGYAEKSSLAVITTTIIGLMYLFKLCKPFTKYTAIIFICMFTGFIITLTFFADFFSIQWMDKTTLILVFVLSIISKCLMSLRTKGGQWGRF